MQRMRIAPEPEAIETMFRIPNLRAKGPGDNRPMKLEAFMMTSCK